MDGSAQPTGGDAADPWDGYDAAALAVRVALLVRAMEWAVAPLYDLAGLLDDFDAAQLSTLVRHGAPFASAAEAGARRAGVSRCRPAGVPSSRPEDRDHRAPRTGRHVPPLLPAGGPGP
jgi:hypothetical protein